ncbi:MAG: energy transducer TonB [Bdellovibrionales bacterium]
MSAETFPQSDDFKSSLKLSVIAHGVIVAVFTIKAYFFSADPIEYSSAVRVDIIALPDKLDPSKVMLAPQDSKSSSSPKSAADPAKPEPDTISLKKTKTQQQEALEKLKRLDALEKIKKQVESEKKSQNPGKGEETKQKISQVKGNILSPGTALTGLSKLQHEQYIASLDQHVKQNWALPEWLAKRQLKARARVKIGESGQILAREIILSSGNSNYDEIVLETIERSAPFPVPPEKFSAIVSHQGIVIGFPE